MGPDRGQDFAGVNAIHQHHALDRVEYEIQSAGQLDSLEENRNDFLVERIAEANLAAAIF